MQPSPLKLSIAVMAACAFAYVASYASIRLVRPECINTNDGPIAAFTTCYYPLLYIDSRKPAWYSKTRGDWLAVKIEQINPGNGYLHFSWEGGENGAFWGAELHGFTPGDSVLVHFRYELLTLNDFPKSTGADHRHDQAGRAAFAAPVTSVTARVAPSAPTGRDSTAQGASALGRRIPNIDRALKGRDSFV